MSSEEASSASAPGGEESTQGLSAAALRAQKRQARIKANAGQRITSITSNSREEGASYFKNDTPFDKPTASTVSSAPAAQPRKTAPASDDPADVDLALLSSDDPATSGFPPASGQTTGPHGEPDLMALMAQLTGQAPPNGTQADGNDPMAQMMAALNGNGAGGPSMFPPQQAQGPIRPPTLLQRCLPLLHIIAMLALSGWIYVTADMDWSVLVQGTQAGDPSRDAQSWSVERLSLPRVPVIIAFITVEVALQSIRAVVASSNTVTSGMLGQILPMLPHLFGMYARAAMRYWAFVGQLLDDFAMLLFSLGIFGVVHASWLEFSAQSSHAEVEHVEL